MKKELKCPTCSQRLYFEGTFTMSLATAGTYSSKCAECIDHVYTCCLIEGKNTDKLVYEQLEIKLKEDKIVEKKDPLGRGIRGVFPCCIRITNYLNHNSPAFTSIFRGMTPSFNDVLTLDEIFCLGLNHDYTSSHSKNFDLLNFDFSNLEETLQRAETYYMLA